jgi:Asp-tRNA(Asn)/Glu-tRNA(Gln) amidotransferase A subunit family amidase
MDPIRCSPKKSSASGSTVWSTLLATIRRTRKLRYQHPASLDSEGLPIGVQFYGNFTGEDLLLCLAAQLEQARPEWFGARPGVHVAA